MSGRRTTLTLGCLLLGAGLLVEARQADDPPSARGADSAVAAPLAVRITSPLGRTGIAAKVRIVAQVQLATPAMKARVNFLVDGEVVGTCTDGPPYSVDWVDENPFERRDITAVAEDGEGHIGRDEVVLRPFEVTDKTQVTSILLETGVYDKTGRFVQKLDTDSFKVRENGAPQKIDLVTRETLPTTVLLLVDNSQSMSRRMDFVRQAAERLGSSLKPRDQVIVVPFNAHLGAMTGPTDDKATIAEAVDAMHAGGGTAILDALRESAPLLSQTEGRRTIILITDGYDENSTSTVDEVLKTAEAAQTTIYVVGIGGVAGISLKGEDLLKKIANETGGRVFFPPRESELSTVSDALVVDAHSRYLITYTPSDQQKDGSWRAVSVEVPDGYRVRTRAGYFAPAPTPIRPTIEFTVKDASRTYVDVTREDLAVLEDGVPQTVDTFQEAIDPVGIVMALDSSGSMKKSAEAVQRAARDFVEAVRPEDSLALITFADKPLFAHTLSTNRQWTLDAIDKYQALGGTALYDALYNSLLHLREINGRRAVVVLTDGRDEDNPGKGPGSEHSLDEVLKLMRSVGASIYPIGLGQKVDRSVLQRLASESGGEAYFPADAASLSDQYRRVIEDLRRRYVLSYSSTNLHHDGGWRKVVIQPVTPGLAVVSSGGYFAPAQ